MSIFVRSAFNYDVDAASDAAALYFDLVAQPSLAQQSFAEECDINEIVRRFGLTGTLPEEYAAPQSGDFTGITDFQTALNAVLEAEDNFMLVPAEIRERFANDPQRFMQFVFDDRNRDEAVKLGLIPKPPERTRDVVQAVDELAAKLVVKPKGVSD